MATTEHSLLTDLSWNVLYFTDLLDVCVEHKVQDSCEYHFHSSGPTRSLAVLSFHLNFDTRNLNSFDDLFALLLLNRE